MKEEINKLHSNQRLMIEEMIKRGIDIKIIDLDMELVEAKYNNHRELIMDRNSSIIPYTDSVLIGDKAITKKFLKENKISVPIGMSLYAEEVEFVLEAFKMFNKSVVIKPTFGSHGFDVHIDIKTEEEVINSLNKIIANRGNTKILIEEYFDAKEYRVFITREGKYAVLHREPAHIIGDGIHNILELAEIETYKRMNPRTNALCPILIDEEVETYLLKNNMNLNHIPKEKEKIYIRYNSNVAVGGLCIDYTDCVHPSVIEISNKILNIFPGLPYIGIDFMSKDITKKQTPERYKIIEVNSNPGVHMHMNPAIGKSRDVASYMVDLIFPETKEGREMKNLSEKSEVYYGLNDYYEIFSKAEDYPKYIEKELIDITKDKIVLDAGCGSGKFLSAIEKVAHTLYGVDVSLEQINIAKAKVKNKENIICTDLVKLTFEDNKFDIIYSSWVLGTIIDIEKRNEVLKELKRVLKPNGKIILIENNIGGYFERMRDRYPNKEKTLKYNNWILGNEFKKYKEFTSYFRFKNEELAKATFEKIYGKKISLLATKQIEHKIIMFEYEKEVI